MYKVKHGLCPSPVQAIFTPLENNVNLRGDRNGDWVIPRVESVNYGIETLRYRGPITWNLLPNELKDIPSLDAFKEKITKWKPLGCKCRLCKTYVRDLGFLN